MKTESILAKLKKVKRSGKDEWMACCPAHDDKTPSLSVKDGGDRTLLKCFGASACSTQEIVGALGIGISDLFNEEKTGGSPPPFQPQPELPNLEERWNKLENATGQHEYIRRKDGLPDGLKVTGGVLLIPARDVHGRLITWQKILPGGTKITRKGEMGESFFSIGERSNESPVYVCEGVGQAWACYKATGRMSVACFGTGRLGTVSQAIRKVHSGPIVLVPDRGAEDEAGKAAIACNGLLWMPPEHWAKNRDVNDFIREAPGNASLLEDMLLSAREPDREPGRYTFVRGMEIMKLPTPQYIIRGVLPDGELTYIFGESETGKTFIALDMCLHIAHGIPWQGLQVQKRPIVYVASEGSGAIKQRVAAWCKHHSLPIPDGFSVVGEDEPFSLANDEDVQDMADCILAEGLAGAVIVYDTLNQSSSGSDENSNSEMGAVVKACKMMARRVNGAAIVVHHSGIADTGRLRGASALNNGGAAALCVQWQDKEADVATLSLVRNKEGGRGFARTVHKVEIVLDIHDCFGVTVSSCYLDYSEWTKAQEEDAKKPKKMGANQIAVLAIIGENIAKKGKVGMVSARPSFPCITYQDIRELCPLNRQRVHEAVGSLVENEKLIREGDWICLF
jgi:putative DNA primase/helicase